MERNCDTDAGASDARAESLILHGSGEWGIRRSDIGMAVAITCDGWDVLHLNEGTTRNEACIESFVRMVNASNVLITCEQKKD